MTSKNRSEHLGNDHGSDCCPPPAEHALRQTERRFAALIALLSDFYMELDADLRISKIWSEKKSSYLEQVLGKHPWEQPGTDPSAPSWQAHIAVLEARQPYRDFEYSRVLRRGDRIWMSVSGQPFFAEDGRFLGYQSVCRNITARKREEDARRVSEERLQLAFEAALDGFMDRDLETGEVYFSPACYRLLGYEPGELPPTLAAWDAQVHPDDMPRIHAIRAGYASRQLGKVLENECRRRAKDGSWRWVHARGQIVAQRADGSPTREIVSFRDVTERREREEALREAKETAEAASVAKLQFLANTSHEIRTPLNGILGMIQLALTADPAEPLREHLATMQLSAESLLAVINDILDYSKIEADRLELECVQFPLRAAVADTVRMLAGKAAEKNLLLECRFEPDVPDYVISDPTRLRQILLNLIGNAVKFTEKGRISVHGRLSKLFATELELEFQVVDTGIGISSEQRARIFQSFTQGDASITRRYGGTGLGLAICERLARLLGGAITVDSVVGLGSTFTFSIRCGIAEARAPAALQPEAERSSPAVALDALRLLVVEDNIVNQRVLTGMLERHGHRPQVAANGFECLRALEEQTFDAILMDVQMPEMDGLEATRAIRARESLAGATPIPIIALTANALIGDREHCIAAGMTDYLAKPVRFADLIEALARATNPILTSGSSSHR